MDMLKPNFCHFVPPKVTFYHYSLFNKFIPVDTGMWIFLIWGCKIRSNILKYYIALTDNKEMTFTGES